MNLRSLKGPLYKEKISLAIFFVVTGIIFYAWVYAPFVREIGVVEAEVRRLKGEAAQYQLVVSSSEKDAKRLEEIMAAYNVMEAGLLFVKERLPSVKQTSSILKEVSGRQPGLSLISIQPLSIEDKGMYLRFPVALQMRGDFTSFGKYLSGLDSSKRLIGIENVNIVREAQQGVSVKMDLNVYLLKEGAL